MSMNHTLHIIESDIRTRLINIDIFIILQFGIVCLAFFLRLMNHLCEPLLSRDGVLYVEISNGECTNYWIPPLYIVLLKILHYISISYEHAGIIINLVAGSLLCLPGIKLAGLFTKNHTIPYMVGFLIAVHPTLIALSSALQRDSLYLLFESIALVELFKATDKHFSGWIYAAISNSFATVTRIEAVEFCLLVLLAFLFETIWCSKRWKYNLYGLFIFIVIYFVFSIFIFYACSGFDCSFIIELKQYILKRFVSSNVGNII